MNLKNSLNSLGNIFSNWKYVFVSLSFAVLFYLLNVLIFDITTLHSFSDSLSILELSKIFFLLALDFGRSIDFYSFITIILISILFGIFVSLIFHKTNLNAKYSDKKIGILGWLGILLGLLIPGCTLCGVGILSLMGLSAGALSFLPKRGLELSILAIAILLFTVLKLSENMYSCEVNSIKKMKGGY